MATPAPHGVPEGRGAAAVPPHLAELLRAQLEEVADEVEEEVRGQVPEYARPADGTYRENLRAGVVQALTLFVDHIADPRGRGTRSRRRTTNSGAVRPWRGAAWTRCSPHCGSVVCTPGA